MFKFINVKYTSGFEDSAEPFIKREILDLFYRYKHVLFDDYYQIDKEEFDQEVIELINSLYPHFWAVLTLQKPNQFIGFIYLDGWKGSKDSLHSCFITTAAKKEYWGEPVFLAGLAFIDHIVKTYKLKKVKAEVFAHNKMVIGLLKKLGFIYEARLKSESIKNKKALDTLIFSYFTHYLKEY